MLLTSFNNRLLFGFEINENFDKNIHITPLQDIFLQSTNQPLFINFNIFITCIAEIYKVNSNQEILLYILELNKIKMIVISNSKARNIHNLGQYILQKIKINENTEVLKVKTQVMNYIHSIFSFKSEFYHILRDMQNDLTRYISFVAIFNINSHKMIISTIHRKDNVLAEAIYKELVQKEKINKEIPEFSIKSKILGNLQIFYFLVLKKFVFVCYSASIQINTGIIILKLKSWINENLEKFSELDNNEFKTQLNIPILDHKLPSITITIKE